MHLKLAQATPEVCSRCGQGTLDVCSRYTRRLLTAEARAKKLPRMAQRLQPTEPRPPAAQRVSLALVSLAVFGHGSCIAWFSLGSVTVQKYVLSTVGVRFTYGIGTVPLRFGIFLDVLHDRCDG